jgi:hypothetical protein
MKSTVSIGRACALGLCAGCLAGFVACVLADPPPELPTVPQSPPRIESTAVVPPTNTVISVWPTTFIVPVDLDNPTVDFEWRAFVDFNPNTGTFQASGTSRANGGDAGTRIVDTPIPPPRDLTSCHVVEFLVAIHFVGNAQHEFDSVGGDGVAWMYNPSGDPAGCPTFDAGSLVDGSFPPVPDGGGRPEAGGGE